MTRYLLATAAYTLAFAVLRLVGFDAWPVFWGLLAGAVITAAIGD